MKTFVPSTGERKATPASVIFAWHEAVDLEAPSR